MVQVATSFLVADRLNLSFVVLVFLFFSLEIVVAVVGERLVLVVLLPDIDSPREFGFACLRQKLHHLGFVVVPLNNPSLRRDAVADPLLVLVVRAGGVADFTNELPPASVKEKCQSLVVYSTRGERERRVGIWETQHARVRGGGFDPGVVDWESGVVNVYGVRLHRLLDVLWVRYQV